MMARVSARLGDHDGGGRLASTGPDPDPVPPGPGRFRIQLERRRLVTLRVTVSGPGPRPHADAAAAGARTGFDLAGPGDDSELYRDDHLHRDCVTVASHAGHRHGSTAGAGAQATSISKAQRRGLRVNFNLADSPVTVNIQVTLLPVRTRKNALAADSVWNHFTVNLKLEPCLAAARAGTAT
jgi:hypothetical protein